jgi:hypothetical protein
MPKLFDAGKEDRRENPVSDQHVKKRQLARAEAEALDTRIFAPFRHPAFCNVVAMIDGTLHFIPLKESKAGENALIRLEVRLTRIRHHRLLKP